jgi:branched-chain amino acid transport system substrate-binding protein
MTRNRNTWAMTLLAVVALFALIAAACGDDDNTTKTTTTTSGTPAASASASGSTAAKGSSTAGTSDAAAKIASITGDTTGVTKTDVTFGTYYALTGPAAVYAPITEAWKAYFDNVNKNGGIAGRQIKFNICDDGYNPANTVKCLNKLLQQDQVFAIYSGLGTPPSNAALPIVQAAGVPSLFINSGDNKWGTQGDSIIGFQPDYVTEGTVLGKFAADNYKDKKFAIIYQNDDFGKEGEQGLKSGLGDQAKNVVDEETYEANAPDWNSQATKAVSKGAEVMLVFSTPTQYAAGLKYQKAQGKNLTWIASSVAASSSTAALAQGAMDGTFTGGYLPDPTDPSPDVQKVVKFLKDNGISNPTAFSLFGYTIAQMLDHLLTVTGANLNRSSIEYALQNVAFTGNFKPDLLEVAPKISKDNMYPVQYEFIQKWDEGKKAFVKVGNTIDLTKK